MIDRPFLDRRAYRRQCPQHVAAGFTLLEIVTMLVLMAVLASFFMGGLRFFSTPSALDVETARMTARIAHTRNMGVLMNNPNTPPCLRITKTAVTYEHMPPLPGEGTTVNLVDGVQLVNDTDVVLCFSDTGLRGGEQSVQLSASGSSATLTVNSHGFTVITQGQQ
ncbi:MAG: hypothetical protein ACI33N_05600 [Desulfovibrionaceae bacterium]